MGLSWAVCGEIPPPLCGLGSMSFLHPTNFEYRTRRMVASYDVFVVIATWIATEAYRPVVYIVLAESYWVYMLPLVEPCAESTFILSLSRYRSLCHSSFPPIVGLNLCSSPCRTCATRPLALGLWHTAYGDRYCSRP